MPPRFRGAFFVFVERDRSSPGFDTNKKPSGFPEGSLTTDTQTELRQLKPLERACARCKLVRLNSHPLQDIDEQVW